MRPLAAVAFLAATFFALPAFADDPGKSLARDKVAVLPFLSNSRASPAQLDEARVATRSAVVAQGHLLPSDSEMITAITAVADGVPDTSAEYRAAGRSSSSQWTVIGHVDPHGATYKVELEACQVDTGRVESLAREIDPAQAQTQIAEMLALLLRPEGLANADIPWEHQKPPEPVKPPPPKPPEPPKPPPKPPEPPPPPAKKHPYGEDHPFAAGLGLGLFGALAVPPCNGARCPVGSTLSLMGAVTGEYAFAAAPGFALRADIGGALYGPGSFWLDAGARYAFAIAPTIRLYAGPELDLGAFVPLKSGDQTARFLLRGQAFVALGLGDRVQLEVAADFANAFGGTGTLALGGGTVRGLFRF